MSKLPEPQTILSLLQRIRKRLSSQSRWSLLWDAADEYDTPMLNESGEVRRRSLQATLERLYVDERPEEAVRIAAYGPMYYAVWELLEQSAVEIYGDEGTRLKTWASGGYDRVSVALSRHGHDGLLKILDKAAELAEK